MNPLFLLFGVAAGAGLYFASKTEKAGTVLDTIRADIDEGEVMVTDWIATLLRKTSEHEGRYWSVQRNNDGQGVSYGIIQWTQLAGGLYKVLSRMQQADPAAFARIFGPTWQSMMATVQAKSLAPVDGAVLWAEPWLSRFIAAGNHLPFQNAQDKEAATSEYMQAAVEIAGILGVSSERAMTMYYNRTVHQGPGGAKGPAKTMAAWYAADPRRRPTNPNDVLAQYAWRCAAQFRKIGAPKNTAYNRSGLVWKAVTTEWSELTTGNYTVRKVAAPASCYHVFAARFPVSLYDLITKRSSDILTDPSLRDEAVDLAVAGVPPATALRQRGV